MSLSPTSTQYLVGTPWRFFWGSENPSVRVAHFAFEITLSRAITLTLLLVCAFSPKVQKYLLGSPFLTIFRVSEKTQKVAKL